MSSFRIAPNPLSYISRPVRLDGQPRRGLLPTRALTPNGNCRKCGTVFVYLPLGERLTPKEQHQGDRPDGLTLRVRSRSQRLALGDVHCAGVKLIAGVSLI